jgi:hypothetical protein
VFITDEDDCSASDDAAFDSTAPPEGGCRCFEMGVTCDAGGCFPNEASPYVHPVERYYEFFSSLKPPGQLFVAAVSAPLPEDGIVETTIDGQGNCALVPTCTPAGASDGAYPTVRIADLVRRFDDNGVVLADEEPPGICGTDFHGALRRLGERWGVDLAPICLREPPVSADSGAPIVHPDEAVCVGTEYNPGVSRDLPRCVFEEAAPVACVVDLFDPYPSPGVVRNAPCWYLCDAGSTGWCQHRWSFRTCRERTCAPDVPAPRDTEDCLACLTCSPGDGGTCP